MILLFDVDGTICESGKKIEPKLANLINEFKINYEIGIVGGGTFDKIIYQLDNLVIPNYIFSECGSVYHIFENNLYKIIYKNNIRLIPEYNKINTLVKEALSFISKVDYIIAGNLIDLRNGLIYISLVGMSATEQERNNFIKLDKENNYRNELLSILKLKAIELNINEYLDITLGGSIGIAIYPKEWNKIQVLKHLNNNSKEIHYFGDKYLENGNDYEIMNDSSVNAHCIDSLEDTYKILSNLLKN